MAAQRPPFLLLALALAPFFAVLVGAQSTNFYPGLFCPTGFAVETAIVPGYFCSPDPCYGNPCGSGNTCNTAQIGRGNTATGPIQFLEETCQCNAPSLTGYILAPFASFPRCYQPGQDVCNPNPCQNGGTCSPQPLGSSDRQIIPGAFTFSCSCPQNFVGPFCQLQLDSPGSFPPVQTTVNGITGPLATSAPNPTQTASGNCPANFPNTCLYKDNSHYLCCDSAGCGPYDSDGNTPLCRGQTNVPSPNNYPPPNELGDQGLCGQFPDNDFPVRCWFNNDPQGRYFCCSSAGCAGFGSDSLTPNCASGGPQNPAAFVVESNPNLPNSGTQGVCGEGDAKIFPNRCYFNNDPQGRYVCCDIQGCDGFNPPDYLTPHCKNYGYVPPGYGVGATNNPPPNNPPPPSGPPPSGNQGVCGSGDALYFPNRCWFNNDPQHRYVCCDNAGCDGFLSDNLFPHCAGNGYVPPNAGA